MNIDFTDDSMKRNSLNNSIINSMIKRIFTNNSGSIFAFRRVLLLLLPNKENR